MSKECTYCGFSDPMPFTCKFCGGSFCYNHRLPESHNCPGLARLKQQVRESGKLYVPEPALTGRMEKRSQPGPVSSAISVMRSSYSLTILVLVIISFVLQIIFGYKYTFLFELYPGEIFFQPLKLMINLVTHIFLHSDGFHILFNMLFLYFFGPELERRIGGNKFLAVFFVSGIVGGIVYVLWSLIIYYIFNAPPSPAIGASGALFGIFGCLAILAPEMRVYAFFVPIPLKLTQALVFFTLLDVIFIAYGQPIALAGHLGGAAAGLIMGWWIKKKGGYVGGHVGGYY